MNTNIFDRISFVSLFLVIVLLPLFFLPFTLIPIETSKGLLLVVGLAVSLICWGLARFFDGKINLPRSPALLAGLGVVLAFLLSALFLKASQVSFFGTMFDIGTFWFIFAAFLLMLMSSIILSDPKKAKIVLFGTILSGAVVLVFQALHLFMPKALSLGVLANQTSNLLGSWNELGIFAGFASLMLILVVEFFPISKIEKMILQILTVISIIMVATVNFAFVWELLGIFALIIFVYKVSLTFKEKRAEGETEAPAHKNRFPIFSFIIIMIALLFVMSGNVIGGIIPTKLGIQNNEISPSFVATTSVTKSVLKVNPIFGIGPNRFSEAWAKYRPLSINTTPFWDVSFNTASGLLPTFASTTGILGILALLSFVVLFVVGGVKSIFSSIKNGINWETMAFFVLSFYLFVACFFYPATSVLFLLALAFGGIFIGLSAATDPRGQISVSYLSDHRKSFFSILFIVVLLIVTAGISFKYIGRFTSVAYFTKALTAPDLATSETSITKALRLYQNDLYWRTYAQVYLLKLDAMVKKGDTLTDAEKATLQPNLDQAVNGATAAINFNPKNYLNYQALGSVYQSLGLLGVRDVYSKAVDAYKMAAMLNPNNPGIQLALAGVSFGDGKVIEAKDYANAALTLKPDYVEALITLSQIANNQKDSEAAISYAEKALALAPSNTDLAKYVETLKKGISIQAPLPTPVPNPIKTPKKP